MAVLPIAATISAAAAATQQTGATIAPIRFHGWQGWTPALQTIVDVEHRPGDVGTIAQGVGQVGESVTATAYRFEITQAASILFAASVEALPSPSAYILTDAWARRLVIRISKAKAPITRGKGPPSATNATQTGFMIACSITYERLPDA